MDERPSDLVQDPRPAPEPARPAADAARRGQPSPAGADGESREQHDSDDRAKQRDGDPSQRADAEAGPGLLKSHPYAAAAIGILIVLAAIAGVLWWLQARHYENTDDAFIDTRTVSMSPQVAGAITDVAVGDNEVVDAGTVLVRIDDRDYVAARDQARAQIDQAGASIATYEAQIAAQQAAIEQARKQVAEAKAALTFAEDENKRYQDLVKSGSGTVQRAEQAASDLRQKQAAFDSAQAAQTASEKQIGVLQAQRASASAQLEGARAQGEQAEANLSRSTLTAPVRGRVTKLSAAKGGYAAPGQALLILVPQDLWVTANFKETQLTDMRVGQPVSIRIDAYPGRDFTGRIDSIQAGSGTAFSLLPAENATGNYVKVVQRVPVKIVFDKLPDVPLGPGMSVVPSVTVR